MSTMQIEIYSDIACPWCLLGKKRFERALAAFPGGDSVEVVYRPFQLDPSAPEEPKPHAEMMAAKFGPSGEAMDAQLTELAAKDGVVFDFPRVIENNSLTAHRLLWLALNEYGPKVQQALKDRLLTGHFAEGLDIGDHAVLTAAAEAAGLDATRVTAFLAGSEGLAEVREQIAEARELGVTAVPTFVFQGTYAVQGAQETSAFLQALEQVSKELEQTSATRESAPADPGCADGACAI